MEKLQFPATNIEAEQAALGCALLDLECARQLVSECKESDFTYEPHRLIFRAIKTLLVQGLSPDPITVHNTLQTLGVAEECGGQAYLVKLAETPPALSNFPDYLALVKEGALRHRVWQLAQQLSKAAAEGNGWQNLVGELQALTAKATTTPRSVFVPLKDWQPANERVQLIGDLIGSGELVLLYARPKVGKSILCANLVKGIASGTTALGLPCRKGRVGVIALEDLAIWHERLTELEVNPENVFVTPTPVTIIDLPTIKQAITELGLSLLIIDPLALFLRPLLQKERASLSRDYDAVYSALGALREVAQATGCAVIMVHHERKESAGAEPTEAAALGSTALSGAVDVGLQLDFKEQEGERHWRLSWWGRSVTAGELWLRLRPDLVFEPTTPPTPTTLKGRAIATLCEALKERPYRYTDLVAVICQRVGCSERTAKRAIDAAEKQGLIAQRADKFYELLDKSPICQKGHWCQPIDPDTNDTKTVKCQVSTGVMTPVGTNGTNAEVSKVSGSIGWHYCHQLGALVCALCGNKLSEISATPTCPYCWASGEEVVARCACGEPLRSIGVGRAQCPECGQNWRWVGDHWASEDSQPPDTPEPDSDPTPLPTVTDPEPPVNEPESSEGDFVDTTEWIASFEVTNEPAVYDLETNEAIPVGDLSPPTRKEAKCPRCGHEESITPDVLLPPFCPACGSAMDWVSDPDPPPNSLLDAVKRLSDLSSQLSADSKGGGRQ